MEIKGIPDGITEQQVKEWVGVLIERFYNQIYNQKISQIPEFVAATEKAKTDIDGFRKANDLAAKFESPKVEPKVEG